MNNITFDLETLGNRSTAPLVQIGAVKFTNEGEILDQFLRNIKLPSLSKYGFEVTFDTLEWWFSQKDEAIKSVFVHEEGVAVDIRQALREFQEWIGAPGDYVFWSHATFDPPILINAFNKVGLNPQFIPYRNHRDIRTITHFTGNIDVPRNGVHHNALDDCIYQAAYISQGIQILKSLGPDKINNEIKRLKTEIKYIKDTAGVQGDDQVGEYGLYEYCNKILAE